MPDSICIPLDHRGMCYAVYTADSIPDLNRNTRPRLDSYLIQTQMADLQVTSLCVIQLCICLSPI